jgi:hypothetical protein
MMNAKDYLSQARYLDQSINAKIQQLSQLNDLATKATAVLNGMPHSNSSTSTMADTVVKIVDLQNEINRDIDTMVDLKADILRLVKTVSCREYQTILEKRYLCFQSWEMIAASMDYDIRWLYRLHGRALEEVQKMLDQD